MKFTTNDSAILAFCPPNDGDGEHRANSTFAELRNLRSKGRIRDDFSSGEAEQLVLQNAWQAPLMEPVEAIFASALRFVRNKRLTTKPEQE